jgi:uncharacterized protein (TIGR03086 family)
MSEQAPDLADLVDLHRRALAATGAVVERIGDDQWELATPCAGWDVRFVTNHLVAGNWWAAELATGRTIGDVGHRLDGDVLGSDAGAAFRASAAACDAAFSAPGALDAPCAVSYGPVPGGVYLGHRFLDVVVHGWDLATATGQPGALDPDLADACWAVLEPQLEAFRAAGALGPAVDVPADADAQTRLLAAMGRRA